MSPLIAFLWGFGGSLALEVVNINAAMSADSPVPPRYKQFWFWFWRVFLAVMGGGLTIAYGIKENPMLAINVGASAPLILAQLAKGVGSSVAKLPSSGSEEPQLPSQLP